MKTLFKLAVPALAFVLASGGAYETIIVNKMYAKAPTIITAYVNNPTTGLCLAVTANCSVVNTHVNCLSIEFPTQRAFLKGANNLCTVELWKEL